MAECNSQQFFMTATPYSKFTLSQLEARYGVSFVRGAFLAGVSPLPVPDWLKTYLELSSDIPSALKSEKAISEQTIAPVMLAVRDRVVTSIKLALDEAGIDMSYPHMVVRFHNGLLPDAGRGADVL